MVNYKGDTGSLALGAENLGTDPDAAPLSYRQSLDALISSLEC